MSKHTKKVSKATRVSRQAIIGLAAVLVICCLLLTMISCSNNSSSNSSSETSSTSSTESELIIAEGEFPAGSTFLGIPVEGMGVEEAAVEVKKHFALTVTVTPEATLLDGKKEVAGDPMVITEDTFAMDTAIKADLNTYLTTGKMPTKPSYPEAALKTLENKFINHFNLILREAKDSSFGGFDTTNMEFIIEEGQTGLTADLDKGFAALQAELEKLYTATPTTGTTSDAVTSTVELAVTLPISELDYERTAENAAASMGKLGTYSTWSTNTANGNHNMALALSRVNGTLMQPGEVFSYNGTVGDSSNPANGFKLAGIIVNGKSDLGYGGGVCQGSTTLYGAVIRSGLEITMRDCHSIPSSYCPIGQDATISYGYLDFRFRNSTDYPIYIDAYMYGTQLTCTIYGYQPSDWDTIEVASWQTSSEPFEITFKEDESIPVGEYELDVSGLYERIASAVRQYYKNGSLVREEWLPDSYYPMRDAIYLVNPETDQELIRQIIDGTLEEYPTPTPSPTPSTEPTTSPEPTTEPTTQPTTQPTTAPTTAPTTEPTTAPTTTPEPTETPEPTPAPTPTPEATMPPDEGGEEEGDGSGDVGRG